VQLHELHDFDLDVSKVVSTVTNNANVRERKPLNAARLARTATKRKMMKTVRNQWCSWF